MIIQMLSKYLKKLTLKCWISAKDPNLRVSFGVGKFTKSSNTSRARKNPVSSFFWCLVFVMCDTHFKYVMDFVKHPANWETNLRGEEKETAYTMMVRSWLFRGMGVVGGGSWRIR